MAPNTHESMLELAYDPIIDTAEQEKRIVQDVERDGSEISAYLHEVPEPDLETLCSIEAETFDSMDAFTENVLASIQGRRQYNRAHTRSNGRKTNATPSFDTYMESLGNYPLLTRQEVRSLGAIIERGQTAQHAIDAGEQATHYMRAVRSARNARETMIRSNVRLVVNIASKYPVFQGHQFDDYVQEGNLGLIHAVEKFDYTRDIAFSTYATFWIKQAIQRGIIMRESLIRIPGDKIHTLRRAYKNLGGRTTDAHYTENDRNDFVRSLPPDAAEIHRRSYQTSLDISIGDGDDVLGNIIASDTITPEDVVVEHVTANELTLVLHGLLGRLTPEQRTIVQRRTAYEGNQPTTYQEMSNEFGLSVEQVRRIYMGSIAILQMSEQEFANRAAESSQQRTARLRVERKMAWQASFLAQYNKTTAEA